jgi:hypothetical protein
MQLGLPISAVPAAAYVWFPNTGPHLHAELDGISACALAGIVVREPIPVIVELSGVVSGSIHRRPLHF